MDCNSQSRNNCRNKQVLLKKIKALQTFTKILKELGQHPFNGHLIKKQNQISTTKLQKEMALL